MYYLTFLHFVQRKQICLFLICVFIILPLHFLLRQAGFEENMENFWKKRKAKTIFCKKGASNVSEIN